MKIRILLLSLVCSVAAVTGVSAAEGKAKGGDKDETVLGSQMDKMGGAFRKLKRQIADASKNADSLALVATIKAAGVESAKEKPAWKPQDAAKFQAKMKEFNDKVAKLEAALKAGKNDEAAKIVDELGQAQKEGHKEFKKPDEKKK
jgi:cytochrome c556